MGVDYDVVIVGSGVVGLFIAYELAHYETKVLVIDRNEEPGFGVSRGHAGVIHVVQPPFNSLRSRLAIEGNRAYDGIARRLHVHLERLSTLLVAKSPVEVLAIPIIYLVLRRVYGKYGFRVSMVSWRGLRRLEPNVKGYGAVKVDGYGVINSFELVYQLFNFCRVNGVNFMLGTAVLGIRVSGDSIVVSTSKGEVSTRYLVNAAGLYSADIARMVGDEFRMEFGKGAMLVFAGRLTNNIVAPLQLIPNPKTKGGAIIPTAFGNTIWGPSLSYSTREDRSVNEDDVKTLYSKFGTLLRSLSTPIKAYAGVRPIPEGDDFIITYSKVSRRIIHLVGIESPGLTAAPAIAKKVLSLLRDAGFNFRIKDTKEVPPLLLTRELIGEGKEVGGVNGEIVCPCMAVSRGDIKRAIERGAKTLDGVMQLTGLGMGMCQGQCIGRAIKIIAEELGVDATQLTKSGGDSWLVTR
ncbi:NAD(P)/FAD-dependent oxidoreductase [Vulcanisaeta thermophila]|uniref:NAD(P)/FAD-dependent oxidoreductase n=1 Tax=Vulcanisaeta thermophila TaxID=867917 RepID=UPI000853ED1B|nr:FAD-dependent oxidoreductase [Vulcanisaeta thermophila]